MVVSNIRKVCTNINNTGWLYEIRLNKRSFIYTEIAIDWDSYSDCTSGHSGKCAELQAIKYGS